MNILFIRAVGILIMLVGLSRLAISFLTLPGNIDIVGVHTLLQYIFVLSQIIFVISGFALQHYQSKWSIIASILVCIYSIALSMKDYFGNVDLLCVFILLILLVILVNPKSRKHFISSKE